MTPPLVITMRIGNFFQHLFGKMRKNLTFLIHRPPPPRSKYQRYLLHTPTDSHTPTRIFVDLILPPWKVCLFLSYFVLRFRSEKTTTGQLFCFRSSIPQLEGVFMNEKNKNKGRAKEKNAIFD